MENIITAKTELLNNLRARYEGVILGGGIREHEGREYIVVFVAEPEQKDLVPVCFSGNEVVAEVRKMARFY